MTGLNVRVRVEGAAEAAAACRRMSRTAQREIRQESVKIANEFVPEVRAAAVADSRQSALLAPTVTAGRDLLPSITAGGGTPVGRHGKPAGALIFASEFGMRSRSGWYGARRYGRSRGRQWKPRSPSWWFFRTVDTDEAFRKWLRALDRLIREWGAGG
jgi:hypothetical protein